MSELSRSQFPPGGWQFYQPQTGWNAPSPKSSTFDQTVVLIIKHRLANPALLVKHKWSTDPASVANELETYTRMRLGIPASPKSTPPAVSAPPMPGAVQASVAAVKKLAAGVAVLMDWEESGLPPEPPDVSEARAVICSDCPKNDKYKSITEFFTVPTAAMIKRRFERLQAMKLTTTRDNELNVCQACLCPLQLKVHTPAELIKKRLKPEQKVELDPRCWILKFA